MADYLQQSLQDRMATSSTLSLPLQARLAAAWRDEADRQALEQLIVPLMPRIRRAARRMSAHHAEDLTAEAMIALIESIARWPGESHGNLAGFIWPAVRGAMITARTRAGMSVTMPERRLRDGLAGRLGTEAQQEYRDLLNEEPFDESQSPAQSPASEDLTLNRERSRHLRTALARALRPLTRIERRLVVDHLLHESEALEQIAGQLKLSPARARALEGRALHKMRNNLMINGFMKSDLV